MKNQYADYMISWIDKINPELSPPIDEAYKAMKLYWSASGNDFNEIETKEVLWTWIDGKGGPRITDNLEMVVARMILCLAYKDQGTMDELKDIGFFEDLLEQYGYSRSEINQVYERKSF